MGFPPTWPEEAIAILRQGWEIEGRTSTSIANELNQKGYSFTRNSIIGKAHRLKLIPAHKEQKMLSGRISQAYKVTNKAGKRKEMIYPSLKDGKHLRPHIKSKSSPTMEVPVSTTKPNGSRAILLTHTKEDNCRAIIGYIDGKCSKAVCCGEPTVTRTTLGSSKLIRLSWCAFHKGKFFTDPKPRRGS